MMDTQPLRAVFRVKNNRIIRAREALGYSSIASACRASGIQTTSWCCLETMHDSPLRKNGTLREVAEKVSDFLGCEPDYLWPDVVISYQGPRELQREFTPATSLLEAGVNTPEQLMLRAEAEQHMDRMGEDALALTPREQKVINLRYGLSGCEPRTLGEIGQEFEVTSARIQHIEMKALRKLRLPCRAPMIQTLVDLVDAS